MTDEAPPKLVLELVRNVEGETEPVVINTVKIKKTDEIVYFPKMKPMPRAYFVNSFIKREKEVKTFLLFLIPHGTKKVYEYVARANSYYSETLDSLGEKIPKYSQELENLLLSDDVKQHIEGVAEIQKFQIDSTFLKLILIVFAISIPFGLLMNTVLHLVPTEIVNWGP